MEKRTGEKVGRERVLFMHAGAYTNSFDVKYSEVEESSDEKALQVIMQSRTLKRYQVMAVKRGTDGEPVMKNPRYNESGKVHIKALLNPGLADTPTKRKRKAHRRKAKMSRKGGTKSRPRRLEMDRPERFSVVRALTNAPTGMTFGQL